jgi:hypothetical protein
MLLDCIIFFFLEYAGELHIIALREKNGPLQVVHPLTPARAAKGCQKKGENVHLVKIHSKGEA